MLTLNVKEQELWNPVTEEFFKSKSIVVHLEHSLISMSKWESIWCKPFLPVKGVVDGISNYAEELSYIECMIIGKTPEHLPETLYQQHGQKIQDYIAHPATATKIYRSGPESRTKSIITTELIYYWMIRFQIPMDCEKWHINRLLMLIDICNVKEKQAAGKDKMTPAQAARYQYELNKARRG